MNDLMHKVPQSFNEEIEKEWYISNIPNCHVYATPIPLNTEQLEIL